MMENFTYSIFIFITVFFSSALGVHEVVYARVGDTVTLTIPENTNKYVYWHFDQPDGVQLGWRNPFGGWGVTTEERWGNIVTLNENNLRITGIKEETFGLFYCKADDRTYSFRLLKLTLNTPPPLLSGESLSLSCRVEDAKYQPSTIYWKNPQKKKIPNSKETINVKVTSQDNGDWLCVVANGNVEKEFKVHIVVVDLSPAPEHPQYTSASSSLKIPCSIPPDIPWDTIKTKGIEEIQWLFNPKRSSGHISGDPEKLFHLSVEEPLSWNADNPTDLKPVSDHKNQVKLTNLSLTKRQGKEEDRGEYMCVMKFKNGVTLSRTILVEFLKITSSPGTDLIFGQSLNLTCSLGHPLPSNLQVRWTPPEQSSLPSSKRSSDRVAISEVGKGDGGNWRCELWQDQTLLTSAAIRLNIERKLSIWMMVIISSAAVVILLLILVFILCQRRRRKMRNTRHRLCQCKNPKPKGFYRT